MEGSDAGATMEDFAGELHRREEYDDDDNLVGRWSVYVKDGVDVLHGEYELFHANGLRAERRFYEHGAPAGVWSMWDETGRELSKGRPPDPGDEEIDEPSEEDWKQPVIDESAGRRLPWREYLIEFSVVMALGWLVFFVAAVVSQGYLVSPEDWVTSVEYDDFAFITFEVPTMGMLVQILIPLLWIIWKSDLSWRDVGMVRPRFSTFLLLGAGLGAATLLIDAVLIFITRPPEPPGYYAMPVGAFLWGVLVVSLILNSLVEEIVWRGYALKRLTQMSGSRLFALLMSSALFASYHIYQGFENMLLAFPTGVVYGAAVLITRRIWPVVVAHTVHNVVLYTSLGDWLVSW